MLKLDHIVYAVIKSGKPFDPTYHPRGVALQDGTVSDLSERRPQR